MNSRHWSPLREVGHAFRALRNFLLRDDRGNHRPGAAFHQPNLAFHSHHLSSLASIVADCPNRNSATVRANEAQALHCRSVDLTSRDMLESRAVSFGGDGPACTGFLRGFA
jgi:hypothetical protein